MKRFIFTVLCVSVFFTGLGSLIERAGASLKSDDKALELLRKARAAVGGDQAVGGVRSMTITGKATKTFDFEGVAKTENGDVEINFELPNKMSRKLKLGSGDGNQIVDKQFDVVVVRKGEGEGDNLQWRTVEPGNADGVRKVTVVKKDGTSEEVKLDGREPLILKRTDGNTIVSEDAQTASVDGKKVFIRTADGPVGGEFKRSNELLRTTLSLLASAPEGLDVSYTYVGEGAVDGNTVDIIAANDGSSTLKLFLDRSTSLPRMVSFEGPKPFVIRFKKADVKSDEETRVFERRIEAPEMAEFQIKFSDFRATGGLQLPYKWTQTIGGKADEVLDITSYEINPANIADKFKEERAPVLVRTKKEQ